MQPRFHLLIIGQHGRKDQPLQAHLQAVGYRVCVQPDRAAALPSLTTQRPDLILLGPSLPIAQSLALCRAVRQRSCVPLLLLMHSYQSETLVYALTQGADGIREASLWRQADRPLGALPRSTNLPPGY